MDTCRRFDLFALFSRVCVVSVGFCLGASAVWGQDYAPPTMEAASGSNITESHPGRGVVASGDIDGDGVEEVLYCYKTQYPAKGPMEWRIEWDGGAHYVAVSAVHIPKNKWDGMGALEVGDMDNDGDQDIVAGTWADGIFWLANLNGDASSWSSQKWIYYPYTTTDNTRIFSYPNIHDLALGDIDGDNDLDVAAAIGEYDVSGNRSSGLFSVFMNSGNGSQWAKKDVSHTDSMAASVALADLTGSDGLLEVVYSGYALGWARNTGGRDGAVSFSDVSIATNSSQQCVVSAAGDLDDDGLVDIVATWPESSSEMDYFVLIPNQGSNDDNAFPWSKYEAITNVSQHTADAIAVVDFNLDGRDDLGVLITAGIAGTNHDAFEILSSIGSGDPSASKGGAKASTLTPHRVVVDIGMGEGIARAFTAGVFSSEGTYDAFPDVIVGGADPENPSSLTGNTYVNLLDNTTVNAYKPGVDTVTPTTGRVVEVAFNVAMSDDILDPSVYTYTEPNVDQPGLTSQPTSVERVDDKTARLIWTAGGMSFDDASTVTLTVSVETSVRDALFQVPMSAGDGPTAGSAPTLDAPKVVSVEAQSPREVLITFNVHLNDNALTPGNYTISGDGQGSLSDNPDTVNAQSDTEYLLSWNSGTMLNKEPIFIAVQAAMQDSDPSGWVRSYDGLPFIKRDGNATGTAVSPVMDISTPSPEATIGGPVEYHVGYYTPGYKDANITVNLTSDDILYTYLTASKAGGALVPDKSAAVSADVTVETDPNNANRRIVTFSNITGEGNFGFKVKSGTAVDDAGNPAPASDGYSATVAVDKTPPTLTLADPGPISVRQYSDFDPLKDENGQWRVTASDTTSSGSTVDLTAQIVADPATVDTSTTGTVSINYGVADAAGNSASVPLTVNVLPADRKLTVQSGAGGTTNPPEGTFGYDQGATATVTATPDRCHAFTGWVVDGDDQNLNTDNPLQLTMDADHTVEAQFETSDCAPGIEVVWPNGGEQWPMGKTVQILWRNYALEAGSESELSLANYALGGQTTTITRSAPNQEESRFDWAVVSYLKPGNQYKAVAAWASESSITDQSDANFSIVANSDDISAYAKNMTTDGTKVSDRFDYEGDIDWFYFFASKGVTYTINTADLGPDCDTYLKLFDKDGQTLLDENDNVSDHDWSSRIEGWTAPADHSYFAQVTFSPDTTLQRTFGPGTNFTLQVAVASKEGRRENPPAVLFGRVTDAITGTPLERAEVSLPNIGSLTAFTNAEGRYILPGLASMNHEMQAYAGGYLPGAAEVYVVPGGRKRVDFALTPEKPFEGEEESKLLSVTAQAGPGGTVEPLGSSIVPEGDVFTVRILPDACHNVADVRVDGVSVGAVSSYVFHHVSAHHVLSAIFEAADGREPDVPYAIEASQGLFPDHVRILWRPVDGAEAYRLFRATAEDFSDGAPITGWVLETWVDDYALWDAGEGEGEGEGAPAAKQDDVRYYYRVVARNACGESDPSPAVEGYPALGRNLAAPTNVQASDGAYDTQIEIWWDAVEGAVDYAVFRSREESFDSEEQIGPWTTDTYAYDTNIPPMDAYNEGCRGKDRADVFYYRVVARNAFGMSPPSAGDGGHVGYPSKLYEPAMPAKRGEDGLRLATADGPLAVRLRADVPILPSSVWGEVRGTDFVSQDVAYVPAYPADGWAVTYPAAAWTVGDVIELVAGAETAQGEAVGPVTARFLIVAPSEAKQAPVPQPDAADLAAWGYDPSTVAVTFADPGVPPLADGLGAPWQVGPDRAFDGPQRVWLPVPAGFCAADCSLWYYHGEPGAAGWYPVSAVAGWTVEDSALTAASAGTQWLSLEVRYGAVVQFGLKAPPAGAAALPDMGGRGTLSVFLLAGAALILGVRRRRKPVENRFPDRRVP